MKILWIPQISSKSLDGELMLNKDSNFAFLINLIKGGLAKSNNLLVCFEYMVEKEKIEIELDYVCNEKRKFRSAQLERIDFDQDYFRKVINDFAPDVIVLNEPYKVSQLKILIDNMGLNNAPKIVAYVHWLAMDNYKSIKYSQYENMSNADLALVNSNYVISRFDKFAFDHNLFRLQDARALPPSFDYDYYSKPKEIKSKNIIYNHRLSSDEYYLNAFDNLVSILSEVEKIDNVKMPTVYLTNPSGKDISKFLVKPYFKELKLGSQEEYYNYLKSENVNIHLNTFFESKGMWSMSTVESGATGNLCLLPYRFGYAEIFDKNYYGYCDTKSEMIIKLRNVLLDLVPAYSSSLFDNSCLKKWSNKSLSTKLTKFLYDIIDFGV